MESEDSVAAIIPLYNGERFIEEALESVLAQTVPPAEIVVVDDGSLDDGPRLVNKYESRGVRMISQANAGQSGARNAGVAATTAPWIAFLDQDDLWYDTHLEDLLRTRDKALKAKSSRGVGWVYGNLDEIDGDGLFVAERMLGQHESLHPKRTLLECLANDMFVLPGAALVSRAAFECVGGFDEDFRGYEDDDLFLRLFRQGYRNAFCQNAVTQWRIYESSTSYSPTMARSRMRYFRKLVREYETDESLEKHYVKNVIAPRFVHKAANEYRRAVERGDEVAMRSALDDLRETSAHLTPYRRARVHAVLPILRSYRLARVGTQLPLESKLRQFLSI